MNATFKLKGVAELQDQLTEILGVELGVKALAVAARKAFAPVLETAKSLVPVDSGALRDSLKLTVKKNGGGDTVIMVGLKISGPARPKGIDAIAAKYAGHFGGGEGLKPARRWHWIELGTAKRSAHPFLRPALDQNAQEVLDLLRTELAAQIEKALRKRAKG